MELLVQPYLGPCAPRRFDVEAELCTAPSGADLYESELVLKHRSTKALTEAKRVLGHFKAFLGQYPPSPELATSFLAGFAHRRPTTLYRYNSILKGLHSN